MPVLDAWLAPDGTLHKCPECGHAFRAQEIYEDVPAVRERADAIMREFDSVLADMATTPINGIVGQALEELGYLKLATRRGHTDWYYHQSLTHITPAQADSLLAWCAGEKRPWPEWVDRESRRILF